MPYRPWPNETFMRRVLFRCGAAALILAVAFWSFDGRQVLEVPWIDTADLPQRFGFEITSTAQLARLDLTSNANNSYALFVAEISGPDGLPLLEAARVTEYYTGVEGGERWQEGSQSAHFRFRPEVAGPHFLTLTMEESEGWRNFDQPVSLVTLEIREGRSSPFYMFLLSSGFFLGAAVFSVRRARHERMRWAGSDWTDED